MNSIYGIKMSRGRWMVVFAVVGLVLVVAVGVAIYIARRTPERSSPGVINYGPPSEEEKQDSMETKQKTITNTDTDTDTDTDTTTDTKPSEDASNEHASTAITVSITRASQVGATISVRSFVSGAADGTCTITFTKEGQATVTHQAAITFEATAAYCNADIASSSFGASGEWKMSIVAKKGDITSEPAAKTVTINK